MITRGFTHNTIITRGLAGLPYVVVREIIRVTSKICKALNISSKITKQIEVSSRV